MKLLLTCLMLLIAARASNAAVFTNTPGDKDAFVRALAPGLNYGGGGALSVAGTNPRHGRQFRHRIRRRPMALFRLR